MRSVTGQAASRGRTSRRVLPAAALAIVALILCVADAARRPPPCSTGRFLVRGPSLFTGEAEHDLEPVVLDARTIAIAGTCPAMRARVKRTKTGTAIAVAWP